MTEQDEEGNTPLHVALINDRCYQIAKLLSTRRSMNLANKKGEFPLNLLLSQSRRLDDPLATAFVELVSYSPTAMKRLPMGDSLYPWVFGKVGVRPNTIYKLLQSTPNLIRTTEGRTTAAEKQQEGAPQRRGKKRKRNRRSSSCQMK
uniref:Uncharacterized protein n=1 Tax=Grammatophora oceanica TaxID=210454 RepID=A0A7S1VPP7_9STRA|mmetsp:Transcript_52564/g.78527  ORF Transcript_52564/g.78527 Transcript_52564/m.78527 type:complete len:147 (+) Transcript_52564:996-1436(+)